MILKPGITARRDLWSPLANKMGEENWLCYGCAYGQGFSETTSADVKHAQEALESADSLIEDELQLARLLLLHFYYIPSIAKSFHLRSILSIRIHSQLLTTKSAGYWGFIGYFEALHRLQQNFVEKNITEAQNYRCYCECEEKYELICGSEQSENVPLLHRVGDGNLASKFGD